MRGAIAAPAATRVASLRGAALRPQLPQRRGALLAQPATLLFRAREGAARRPARRRAVCALAAAAAAGPPAAAGGAERRGPLDRQYILGLCWQQRRHLAAAGVCLVLCVAGNLATPVLSGALFETLVQGQPFEK